MKVYETYIENLLAGRAAVGRVVAQDGLIDWDDDDVDD